MTVSSVTLGVLGGVTSGGVPAIVFPEASVVPKLCMDLDERLATGATARSTAGEVAADPIARPQTELLKLL